MIVCGIPGSIRDKSHNLELLQRLSAQLRAPDEFRFVDGLRDVPVFSEDREHPAPDRVNSLWEAAREADVLVFATPEYNQGLPGAMKNFVDWLSRDPQEKVLAGKPCAITGATVGRWGTRIAQQQLATTLTACGAHVLSPRLFVAGAPSELPSATECAQFIGAVLSEAESLTASQ